VGLRRGDGEREREGKIWGKNEFWGQKNGYRRRTALFQNQIFASFFFKMKKIYILKAEWLFLRRKGPGRGRLRLSLLPVQSSLIYPMDHILGSNLVHSMCF